MFIYGIYVPFIKIIFMEDIQMKRFMATLLTGIIAFSVLNVPAAADTVDVFIAGDSTACEYGKDEKYALPRAGWGMYLGKYAKDVNVTDYALSGRSSKSFTTEDNYYKLMRDVGEGDYVIIQFGHNDAKNSSDEDKELRYTDPKGDKDTEGSFKNSLYKNYILPVQEKGATPILLTPISRRNFEDNGKVKDSHGLYDDAVRELADELGITYIDMTKITEDIYNKVGENGAMYYHAIYNDREKGKNGIDNTHLNHWGGEKIAYLTASELAKAGVFELSGQYDDSALTRGEFTQALVRVLQLENADAKDNFSDINTDAEYAESVAVAKAFGIVLGDEKAVFNGERTVTSAEMLLMLERGLKACGAEMPENVGTTMDEHVKNAVSNLKSLGLDEKEKVNLTSQDCYAILTDAFNEVTELKSLQAEKEQSLDEIEATENVVIDKK